MAPTWAGRSSHGCPKAGSKGRLLNATMSMTTPPGRPSRRPHRRFPLSTSDHGTEAANGAPTAVADQVGVPEAVIATLPVEANSGYPELVLPEPPDEAADYPFPANGGGEWTPDAAGLVETGETLVPLVDQERPRNQFEYVVPNRASLPAQTAFGESSPMLFAPQAIPSPRNTAADPDDNARNLYLAHSPAWQQAYRAAAPEDSAQRDLITQLALPIGEGQTREQARRVEALEAQITLMDPSTAERLYIRLTDPADALGILFHSTLHHVTVKSLLAQLDTKRHELRQETIPVPQGTASVKRRRYIQQTPRVGPASPQPEPQQPKEPQNPPCTDPGPPVSPYRVPPPWMAPWVGQPEDPGGSRSWIWPSLTKGAGMLGMTVSVGLRSLSTVALEKAIEAAWLVFQTTDAAPTTVMGMAGEAAAEAFLAEILGLHPASVRNLNDFMANFPLVDLISPRWIASVKNRGALSTLPAAALTEQLRSQYTSDLLGIITGDKKVEDAAEALLRLRPQLGQAWPSDLRATTVEGVARYLREKTVLLVPADHVERLRETLGEDLYRRLKDNKKWLNQLGIKNVAQLTDFIDGQVCRIISLGPRSKDFRLMAEVAAHDIPSEVNQKFRKKLASILKKAARRLGETA